MGSITATAVERQQWGIPNPDKQGTNSLPLAAWPGTAKPEWFDAALEVAGLELRLNIRSQRQQYRRTGCLDLAAGAQTPDGEWLELTDIEAIRLRAELAMAGFPMSRDRNGNPVDFLVALDLTEKEFSDAVRRVCAINAADPFLEYVQNDTPRWDKRRRLSTFLVNCFDVAEESYELAGWAGEYIFMGAVQRALNPGCKLDETPVLIGPGGIGKSTVLDKLFPPELQELFTDGLNLGSDAKTRVEALLGRAVVEIGEMAGARGADIESLKAFLSRRDDGSTRLAYDRRPTPMPRRCVIVGTADRNDPLPPDHNLRRFVPVVLEGGDVGRLIDYLDANRGQLWAEAYERVWRGADARLPERLKAKQKLATDKARHTDAIQDSIERYLLDAPEHFTFENIAFGLGLIEYPGDGVKVSAADQKRIGAALRLCGYQKTRKRLDGALQNVYSRA